MENFQDINELLARWGEAVINFAPRIFLAIIAVLLFYLVARVLKKYSLRFYSKALKNPGQLAPLIATGIYVFLLLSGVFVALEILGLESVLAKLLASAGVLGVVAGFAFKDIAASAFAGFLLNMHRPFKPGDWVSIDSEFGTIQSIGLITTSIKNVLGQEVFVPNQIIYNNTFSNYSSYKKRRVVLKSGVSYGDDLNQVKRVAIEEVNKIENLLKEEGVDFYFTEIGSSTFNFEVRFWIEFQHQQDFLDARSEIIMRIKERFEKENISIAYSVMTLDFGVKGGVNLSDSMVKIKQVEGED